MSEVVIAALIGAAASIIVNLISMTQQSKVKDAKLEARLQSIEGKLDTHNGYAEKLGEIQKSVNQINTDIAVIKNDIKTLYKQT